MPTQKIACSHQLLATASVLVWREDQYASKVVVVPAELLLAEEAYDLTHLNEDVVHEAADVEAYRLIFDEELAEK